MDSDSDTPLFISVEDELIWRAIYDGVVEPWFHRDTLSVELVTPEEAARRREGE